jgi:hypothetical protein
MSSKNNEIGSSSKKSVQFAARDEVFFEISKNNWTKSLDEIAPTVYKDPKERTVGCVAPQSTLSRPNYEGLYLQVLVGNFRLIEMYRSTSSSKRCYSSTYNEMRTSIGYGHTRNQRIWFVSC